MPQTVQHAGNTDTPPPCSSAMSSNTKNAQLVLTQINSLGRGDKGSNGDDEVRRHQQHAL